MKTLMVMIIAGATCVAAPAMAQAPGAGGMPRDQTRAMVQQRAEMIFQMIDANHDGIATRQEAEQAAAQFAARSGDEGHGAGRMQRLLGQAFGDAQSITLQQFEARQLARFDAMDLNHDGVLTASEREQFRAQRSASGAGTQSQIAPRTGSPTEAPTPAVPPPPGQ